MPMPTPPGIDWEPLFAAAEKARLRAHAPYSKFQVGAALLTEGGSIVPGANVENASYGLTVCAERNAIGRLVVDGVQKLTAVAIIVDSREPTPPCGMCRQTLMEFGTPDLEVRSRTKAGAEARWTLGELLPHAFTQKDL